MREIKKEIRAYFSRNVHKRQASAQGEEKSVGSSATASGNASLYYWERTLSEVYKSSYHEGVL